MGFTAMRIGWVHMKPYLGAAGREGNSSNGDGEYNSLLGESVGDVNSGDFIDNSRHAIPFCSLFDLCIFW